jgi:ABC-2 type transport system ATP-binding protein
MIHVQDASKSFGPTLAARRITFKLHPGEVTGLLGPNGAGKTTTIRMIAGYLAPDSGRISVAGHDTATEPLAARASLGYLPESAPLYNELKPAQYLDYRARLFHLRRTDRKRAVADAIDRCRLADMAHKRIGVLSKGYRQRVGLAAALLHDPPVLILDEPTNGLDPSQIRATRALIRELAENRTVLLCTHLIPEVERTCDRALVITRGRLVADGPPERLGVERDEERLELECAGPDDEALRNAIMTALGPAATVRAREAGRPGWVRLAIFVPSPRGDSGEALAHAVTTTGRPLRRLAPAAATLEERVIALIETEGGAG